MPWRDVAIVLIIAATICFLTFIGYKIHFDNQQKEVERTRSCRTIEDQEVRALCVVGVK